MRIRSGRPVVIARRGGDNPFYNTPSIYLSGDRDLGGSALWVLAKELQNHMPPTTGPAFKSVDLDSEDYAIKAAFSDPMEQQGRVFAHPTGHPADHFDVGEHMMSRAAQFAANHLVTMARNRPEQTISPAQLRGRMVSARLFPNHEIDEVVPSDSNTPMTPEDLHAMINARPYRVTTQLGHSGNNVSRMMDNYKAFTSDDHVKYPDASGALVSAAQPGTYRALVTNTPHLAPDEPHWPMAMLSNHLPWPHHGSEGAMHTRGYTVVDPKTGKRYWHVDEMQSDTLQATRGSMKWKLDAQGNHVLDHVGLPTVEKTPETTPAGDDKDWYKSLINQAMAYAISTGHDGIQIGSPSNMNGLWVAPKFRAKAMDVLYFDKAKGHLDKWAKAFDAKVSHVPAYLDYNTPDSNFGGPVSASTQARLRSERQQKSFRDKLRYAAFHEKMPFPDPNDLFGTNVPQMLESFATPKQPGQMRGYANNTQDLANRAQYANMTDENGMPIPSSSLSNGYGAWQTWHQAYHDDSNNYQRAPLPDADTLRGMTADQIDALGQTHDPELLRLASLDPDAYEQVRRGPSNYPVAVHTRLDFTPEMIEHLRQFGTPILGVSSPNDDARLIEQSTVAPPKAKVDQPKIEYPTREEFAKLREEAARTGKTVKQLQDEGFVQKLRNGG